MARSESNDPPTKNIICQEHYEHQTEARDGWYIRMNIDRRFIFSYMVLAAYFPGPMGVSMGDVVNTTQTPLLPRTLSEPLLG